MKLISKNQLEKAVSEHTDLYGWHGGSVAIDREIKGLIGLQPEVNALVIGRDYSSGDYKIITEDHKGYQTFRIVKRR